MKSLWLRILTIVVAAAFAADSNPASGQCPDGCGAALLGSVPGSVLGDSFSAGDSFSGGPCGPVGGLLGSMQGDGSGWGGAPAGHQLGGTCCGPHWYDLMIQGVFMQRAGGDNVALMSRGIQGTTFPNIVQSTDDADFNFEAGFRVGGRFQTSALHSIEAIYLGGLDWDDRNIVTNDEHNLYSVFSDFGNDPFGGFEDSDQASISTIDYDSELDSAELNFRTAIAPINEKTHTSLLWGLRYLRVDESFNHRIDVLRHFDDINNVERMREFTNYQIAVTNDMFGLQGGGESVICISPGIQFGAEGKLGIFGTSTDVNSLLTSTTLTDTFAETSRKGSVSFMSDASMFFLWQFHPMFKVRAGYDLIFINGIGTAASNYDTRARNIANGNELLAAQRVAEADTNDSVFYHGANFGFEFGW